MRPLVAVLVFLLALPAWAEDATVYKRVRPDGTVEFSDEPTPEAQTIEVPKLPTYPFARVPPPAAKPPSAPPAPAEVRYGEVKVTEPAEDGTVFFDERGTPVSVTVTPALQSGHVIAIYLDGQQVAKGPSTQFTLQNVYRGTHTLTAVVESGKGETLLRSAPLTFHLIQHTTRP